MILSEREGREPQLGNPDKLAYHSTPIPIPFGKGPIRVLGPIQQCEIFDFRDQTLEGLNPWIGFDFAIVKKFELSCEKEAFDHCMYWTQFSNRRYFASATKFWKGPIHRSGSILQSWRNLRQPCEYSVLVEGPIYGLS
jgi:hypothetical protein